MNSFGRDVSCRVASAFFALLIIFTTGLLFAEQSKEELEVWKLETNYWDYVKATNLEKYKELWHSNFVGWPMVSAAPKKKDKITDWITAHTNNGERLQWYHIEQAASQHTENVVVVHYWITQFWINKDGNGEPSIARITHTWIKTATGWQIIGGMSAPSVIPEK